MVTFQAACGTRQRPQRSSIQACWNSAGQSLQNFLLQDIGPVVDGITDVAAPLDGQPLKVRRIKTKLFSFTAASGLIAFDPCISRARRSWVFQTATSYSSTRCRLAIMCSNCAQWVRHLKVLTSVRFI
jgi:hypothetical protein